MKYVYWMRTRAGRLLTVLATVILYITLAIVNVDQTFPCNAKCSSFFLPVWIALGFSLSIALFFLAVGSLIWFYARTRRVALLLFLFSCVSMIPFELETSASLNSLSSSLISSIASSLALLSFALLLLVFPRNYLLISNASVKRSSCSVLLHPSALFRYGYLSGLLLSVCVAFAYAITLYVSYPASVPDWLFVCSLIYYIFVLVGILTTVIVAFRQSTIKEREQLRFFVVGVVLSFAPLLLLTVLPQTFDLPSIDAQITTLSIIVLPLSLGYSILRYQILVFDAYIRRTVNWIAGIIFLAMLAYLVTVVSSRVLGNNASFYIVFAAVATAIFAPFVWWLAELLTDRILFRESLHYRRLIDKPVMMGDETLDLEKSGHLITVAAVQAFKTLHVGLFVLSEESGCYHLYPRLTGEQNDIPRRDLATRLSSILMPVSHLDTDVLELEKHVEKRLSESRRPLLLDEVTRSEDDMPTGLSRYLTSASPSEQESMLLAPVRAGGKMIGILVLGDRGDQQSYAGPDFEIAKLILARFSSTLEASRLHERSRQHATLLNDLYKAGTLSTDEFESIEEVASVYASIAADAVHAGIEIWLRDNKQDSLRCVALAGSGPRIISTKVLKPASQDKSSLFYTGDSLQSRKEASSNVPLCLPQRPCFPFAWLPLHKGGEHLGILVLTYSRPHFFLQEEKQVLEMFASQCAAGLENARMTIELRAAYERQKELDVLKDDFMMTASHELRTPLTAVLGYIELLAEYNQTLPPETRSEFIAKAHRGCDELTLMVNNIMDANQVRVDVNNTKISQIPLRESAIHIAEIVESMATREHRAVVVTIPPTLLVLADPIRLRQVLLNLVSNALKYSPAGTDVEITSKSDEEQVTVCVRDYGSGVPLEDHSRLFERFVRLERDMNSPVRGAGLGLYICKQLIEAMGGKIWVESTGREGEGSSFFFTLQRVMPQQQESTKEQHNFALLS